MNSDKPDKPPQYQRPANSHKRTLQSRPKELMLTRGRRPFAMFVLSHMPCHVATRIQRCFYLWESFGVAQKTLPHSVRMCLRINISQLCHLFLADLADFLLKIVLRQIIGPRTAFKPIPSLSLSDSPVIYPGSGGPLTLYHRRHGVVPLIVRISLGILKILPRIPRKQCRSKNVRLFKVKCAEYTQPE